MGKVKDFFDICCGMGVGMELFVLVLIGYVRGIDFSEGMFERVKENLWVWLCGIFFWNVE